MLNSKVLKWSTKAKHLGNVITCDLSDVSDISKKKGVFISHVNKLKCKMSNVSGVIRGRLLQTYCCSWYGCQTWDLTGKSAMQLNTEWKKAVRRTLQVHYKTRSNLLPYLVRGKPFSAQHRSRVTKFVQGFIQSKNTHVSFIGERSRHFSHGALGRNYTRCLSPMAPENYNVEMLVRAQAIRELLDVRDRIIDICGIEKDDVLEMLDFICCY